MRYTNHCIVLIYIINSDLVISTNSFVLQVNNANS